MRSPSRFPDKGMNPGRNSTRSSQQTATGLRHNKNTGDHTVLVDTGILVESQRRHLSKNTLSILLRQQDNHCLHVTTMPKDKGHSNPTTSWQIDEKTVETVADFIWGGSKITAENFITAEKLKDAYSLEEKLLPTQIAYSKAETLLCRLRSVQSRLWFFQQSCMDVRVGL